MTTHAPGFGKTYGSGGGMNSYSGPTLSLAELRPYFERHLVELLNAR